ncbi:MAG: HAMP domain-containing histidine kinase [Chloroflexota bacterium]|nr:HAMP domain-containing histidine kinase [Chloroflexota bacterium]
MDPTSGVPEPASDLAEAIRRVEQEKEEFLSIVAHELKTPLTPLKSMAQLIRLRLARARRGERELDLDSLERNLATIERQVDRMDRLVTDVLEVSRIRRGRFELTPAPMDLAGVVREAVQRWSEAVAEEGRHRLELDAPATLTVTADQQRIEQVVGNLIGNAIKYSPHGGTVHVRLEERPQEAVLTVADGGIGLAEDELAQIGREPFARGRRAHGFAGIGVGLYLSRLVAEGHGGRVELESEGEDKGTTARLILPR